MPDIKDNVGPGGPNHKHDVALVEAMLRIVKNKKGTPYLNRDYGSVFKDDTKAAIIAFQKDQIQAMTAVEGQISTTTGSVLGKTAGEFIGELVAGPAIQGLKAKPGVVEKDSYTLKALTSVLPDPLTDLRVLEDTTTVYVAGSKEDAEASSKHVGTLKNLVPTFAAKVAQLVDQMYEKHKIVLSVAAKSGGPRSFQEQLDIWNRIDPDSGKSPTQAGPGEGNHNFGLAVDLGTKGLTWLQGDGHTKTEKSWWLEQLKKNSKVKMREFYEKMIQERDAIAVGAAGLGLFRVSGDLHEDPDHIQGVAHGAAHSSAGSLVKLLNKVGAVKWDTAPGAAAILKTIKWDHKGVQAEPNHPHANVYTSDLGEGSTTLFKVGSAAHIFAGNADVTKDLIAQARNEKAKLLPPLPGKPAAKPLKAADIPAKDVEAARKALQRAFKMAEDIKDQWQP